MRKPKEIEELIKRAIRDEIALYPLKSVAQVRNSLYRHGYQSLRGELDWHYVSKLMKKVRVENLEELSSQSRTERLVNLKERHRFVTQKLASMLNADSASDNAPSYAEKIAAASTILKWDMAVFFAEESIQQITEVQQKQEVLVVYKESKQIRSRNSATFPYPQNPTQRSKVVPVSVHTLTHPQ